MNIHPTAIISSEAKLAEDVEVGPYAIVDGPVTVGPSVRIYSHAHLLGETEIGAECEIHMGAVIGHLPQDYAYAPCRSFVRVGAGTIIREYATIHRGTKPESVTSIGERCFLMGFSHVAHNCQVGNHVTICNGALLAGYAVVGDGAFISGYVAVHQFVQIGRLAMIGGLARVNRDVPPFMLVKGDSQVWSLNVVGLRRAGFSSPARLALREAFRTLYRSGLNTAQAVSALESSDPTPEVREIIECIRNSERGICSYAGQEPSLDDAVQYDE